MKILRAIGLGIAIIMLKFLVPAVFQAGEHTAINLFNTIDTVLTKTQTATVLPPSIR